MMDKQLNEILALVEHLLRKQYRRGYLVGLAVAEKNLGWLTGPNVSNRIKMIYTWSAKSIAKAKESIE